MYNFKEKDRLFKYYEPYLKSFLFLQLKDSFWESLGLYDLGKDLSVPLLPQNLREFENDGISLNHFVDNMVFVVGANPNFKFSQGYIEVLKQVLKEDMDKYVLSRAMVFAREGDFLKASIYFRSAYILCQSKKEALLNFAKSCKEVYSSSTEPDKIGSFKAESLSAMEQLTIDYPDFDQPYYFLGYFYLNMGLYIKASLSWERYVSMTQNQEGIMEISSRLKEVAEPRKIEEAVNKVISGRYQEGYVDLLMYLNSDYNTWWPLHFYLGIAAEELSNLYMAEERYKNTLMLNPSFLDAIDGLIRIYEGLGNSEMLEKYREKRKVILKNLDELE